VAVRPENLRISLAEPPAPVRLRARLCQRIFAGAMGTCVLDWQGETLKAVGRDRDFADLPGEGEVWLSWDAADTIALEG
jgi:hypothetical protein